MIVPLSESYRRPPERSQRHSSADAAGAAPKPVPFRAARRLAAALVTVCTVAAIFGPAGAITVAPDTVPPPSPSPGSAADGHEPDREATLRPGEAVASEVPFVSENLTCPTDGGPFLLERSANSLQLYLLDAAGLQRIQTDGLALSRVPVCRLPELDDSPEQSLQVLDVQLGGKDYVLFTVTTAQWHHVYLARSANGSRAAEAGTGSVGSAQAIQRIKFAGDTGKAQLLECGGQIYLVTLVTYSNMGTIRVYRWLQSYFSLTSTREVPSLDDVRCHCPGPLLLLALDYEPLPERSLNHVLLLDGQPDTSAPVKVQEVFFLSHSLPSFSLDDDLYLIRHVSKDKCFLYQWNGDARKFVRQRALPFRVGQIGAVASWPGTLAVSVDGAVRLYTGGKQNAFRVESPFTVRGTRQSDPLKQLAVPRHDPLEGLFRLRTDDSDTEVALAMSFGCPATTVNGTAALRVYQLSVMSVTRATEAQELGFRTLNGCLQRLKRGSNERKRWIDLIRLQLARKNLVFDTLNHTGPAVVLHPGVRLEGPASLPHSSPFVLPPTRTALNGQALLLRHYRLATDLNRVLLVNRAKTDIQGDLHVRGNVRTRQTKIRAVDALDERTERRPRRNPRHPLPYRIVRAREVISGDGSAAQKRFWSRTAMTVLAGPAVQLDELHTGTVRLEPGGLINHLPLPGRNGIQQQQQDVYRGHKVFRSVRTGRLQAHRYNGAPLVPELIESSRRTVSDGGTIRADHCHTRNLIVRERVNGFRLDRFASVRQPHVNGNLRLGEGVCVKHLHVHRAIGGAPPDTLLDRLSNQTITGPSFVSKAFTHNLHFGRLNGEPSANLATVQGRPDRGPLLISSPVRTGRLRIRGDLIANHEQQQQWSGGGDVPIGTRPADLRQQYRGKVLLNGSLRVRAATLSDAPNVTVMMGAAVPTHALHPDHYLLRRQRQAVNHPVTYRAAQFQYLFANTLNGAALWQLSLTHHGWQNGIYLQDATVGGHIRPARIAPRLHAIKQARVALHSRVALCDMKHFTGTLRVTALHTDTLGGWFPAAVLWERAAQRYASVALTTPSDLELRSTALLVGSGLHVTAEMERLAVPSVRARYRALHLTAIDADTATLAQTLNVSLAEIVDRFAGGVGATVPSSFARIVPGPPAQHMGAVTVGSINQCPVGWLLGESVRKLRPLDGSTRPVGGWKSVREGAVTVAGELLTAALNTQPTSALERVVTRGAGGQSVEARWQFGSVSAPHLTAKVLNRTPLGRLALRTDGALALHDELFIGRLEVGGLEWAGAPGGWPFETPVEQRVAVVQVLRCLGTVLEPPPSPPPPHWPLLFDPAPDGIGGPIEGLVIFDTREVHLGRSTQHGTAGPPLERIAKQCFRRHVSLAPIFEHGQVLHGPVTVRQHLRLTDGTPLTVGGVSGVPLAERLTPGGPPGHVFLLGEVGPISGRKRWNGSTGASAHNVTLWDPSSPLQPVLAVCSVYQRCTGALHFGHPVTVDQLLTVAHLNRVPFDLPFYAFARRRYTGSPLPIQDFPGTLTVAGLVMGGRGTILHHVNGIPLAEVVSRSTPNASHQLVGGPKAFRAVRIGGPLSLHHLNRVPMARIAQTSLYGGGTGSQLESIVFNYPVELAELRTGTLHHSRTGSTALTTAGAGSRRSALPVPDLLLVAPPPLPPAARVRSREPLNAASPAAAADGSGGLQFRCAADPRSLAIRSEVRRGTPLLVPVPDAGHCHTVVGAVPLNDTTTLVLLLIARPPRTAVTPLAYTYDVRRRERLHPLELPARLSAARTPLATVLLQPDPHEIMLALLPGPATPLPATAVLLYRLVDWAAGRSRAPHFTHFQTITAAGPIATVTASADGTTLSILHEHPSEGHAGPRHQHQRQYVYNAVTGWTEGLQ